MVAVVEVELTIQQVVEEVLLQQEHKELVLQELLY
jgi:hypothetical protein